MKSWNIALNTFLEIKNKAAATGQDLWNYNRNIETCLAYWARLTGEPVYTEMLRNLEICEFKNLLLLKYANVTEAVLDGETVSPDAFWDLYDGLYRECRSVVIDIVRECLVLTPFRKFRNINESEETSYENVRDRISRASCVEVSDKLDGSMQSARFYQGEIVMAGSQSLNPDFSWRLKDGLRMLKSLPGYEKMLRDNPDLTFIFEYISKQDRHVVQYDTEGLFLTGVRSVLDGREASYREVLDFASRYEIPATRLFDKTLDEVMGELDDRAASEAEGFVLNIDGFKVKIKYNDYVFMHKVVNTLTAINVVIENIAEGRFDDLLSKIPLPFRGKVMRVAAIVRAYEKETNEAVDAAYRAAPKGSRKEFMVWVNSNVDRKIRGYVRMKYLGQPYNVLKKSTGYLKLKDMGVTDYKEVLSE